MDGDRRMVLMLSVCYVRFGCWLVLLFVFCCLVGHGWRALCDVHYVASVV